MMLTDHNGMPIFDPEVKDLPGDITRVFEEIEWALKRMSTLIEYLKVRGKLPMDLEDC